MRNTIYYINQYVWMLDAPFVRIVGSIQTDGLQAT